MRIKYGIRTPSLDVKFLTFRVLYSLQQVLGFITPPYQQTKYSMHFFLENNNQEERRLFKIKLRKHLALSNHKFQNREGKKKR